MSSDADIANAYAAMRVAYPRWAKLQDQASLKLWGDMLRDSDGEKLVEAVMTLAKVSKWPPTVAEIREAAGCVDPGVSARRAASEEALRNHERWVDEMAEAATREARRRLQEQGVEPTESLSSLVKGIGR